MRTKCFALFLLLISGALLQSQVVAAPFELLVVAGKITGQCTVVTPGSAGPVAVEHGRAYPYGSAFMTASGASLQLIFSTGNECTLSGEGRLSTAEDKQTPTRKLITLGGGKLDLLLEPGFGEFNALDIDGICTRASVTTGGKFSCESFTEGELRVFVLNSGNAVIQTAGPQFSIAKMEKEQILMTACSPDLTFDRLKAVKGMFEATIRDADGVSTNVAMETGSVIKILQKRSEVENTVVVTLLIIGPDDTVKEAITYNVKADSTAPAKETVLAAVQQEPPNNPPPPEAKKEEPKQEPKKEPKAKKQPATGEWEPMWATTILNPPFPTTTTTTIPPRDAAAAEAYRRARLNGGGTTTTTTQPPTPVGLR